MPDELSDAVPEADALEQRQEVAPDEGAAAPDEGLEVPLTEVRRGHAVSLMLFNGLPSLPLERLDDPDADALDHWTRQRSAIARYALDVLADTEPG